MNNTDLSKKSTRRWSGLGKNPFVIDYTQMEQYEEFKKKEEAAVRKTKTELTTVGYNSLNLCVKLWREPRHGLPIGLLIIEKAVKI